MLSISYAATEKNPHDFLNELLGCFTDGARKETLKSFA